MTKKVKAEVAQTCEFLLDVEHPTEDVGLMTGGFENIKNEEECEERSESVIQTNNEYEERSESAIQTNDEYDLIEVMKNIKLLHQRNIDIPEDSHDDEIQDKSKVLFD